MNNGNKKLNKKGTTYCAKTFTSLDTTPNPVPIG